ncbi:hypothetical protein K502DRAFT_355530 [Neoconidiobolus thromboides FSU 785]|nr:hypothetical protein K502DRAFT_355530 [Neoconidiobolus thromboides FSU 785]
MKFTSVFLLTLVALGYAGADTQATSSIPPAGEEVTPTLDTSAKNGVQGRTLGLVVPILSSVFGALFGGGSGGSYGGGSGGSYGGGSGGYYGGYPYYSGGYYGGNGGYYGGSGGYYGGYPYYSGIIGWNGPNQYYGTVNNYYTIYSPNIKYINNGDGTYTLYIFNISGVQGSSTIQLTCPSNTFKISKSNSGYLCQVSQGASCYVKYS